jgi:hypothetical protein
VIDEFIIVKRRVYVPPTSKAVPTILASAHGFGHEGAEKTLRWLRSDFLLPSARVAVRDYVRACSTCQRNKTKHLHLTGLLQPLEVPTTV